MTTQTITETDRVLAAMLTENTGRHMLDSGDAYGRHWERAQGKTVEDFIAAPEVEMDKWGCVSIDLFHFLRKNLEFDPELQAEFDAFCEAEDDWGLPMMEAFAQREVGGEAGRRWQVINTYNHAADLSQTIQYVMASEDGDWLYPENGFVILQVHGGCDVRGGYTDPKCFRFIGDEYGLLEDSRYEISCSGSTRHFPQVETLDGFDDTPPQSVTHVWMIDRQSVQQTAEIVDGDWRDADLDNLDKIEDLWDEELQAHHCPHCEGTLSAWVP